MRCQVSADLPGGGYRECCDGTVATGYVDQPRLLITGKLAFEKRLPEERRRRVPCTGILLNDRLVPGPPERVPMFNVRW